MCALLYVCVRVCACVCDIATTHDAFKEHFLIFTVGAKTQTREQPLRNNRWGEGRKEGEFVFYDVSYLKAHSDRCLASRTYEGLESQ